MDRFVVIAHADGRRAAVTLEDYRTKDVDGRGHTYQQLGWRIERWEDGEAYTPQPLAADAAPAPKPARGKGTHGDA